MCFSCGDDHVGGDGQTDVCSVHKNHSDRCNRTRLRCQRDINVWLHLMSSWCSSAWHHAADTTGLKPSAFTSSSAGQLTTLGPVVTSFSSGVKAEVRETLTFPVWGEKLWLTDSWQVYICLLSAPDITIFGQTALINTFGFDFSALFPWMGTESSRLWFTINQCLKHCVSSRAVHEVLRLFSVPTAALITLDSTHCSQAESGRWLRRFWSETNGKRSLLGV